MKRGQDIGDFLKPVYKCPTQAFIGNLVQSADILEWILSQTGKADVFQTTFSISEEFVRRIFFIQKDGLVCSYNVVLDHKATQKTLSLWNFISQVVSTAYLADNHSKVMLVIPKDSRKPPVAVISSQNLTRGNRYESSVISSDPEVCNSMHQGILDIINLHSVPLHELLRRRLESD